MRADFVDDMMVDAMGNLTGGLTARAADDDKAEDGAEGRLMHNTTDDGNTLDVRAATCKAGHAVLVRDVSATFQAGRFTAIVGPNGAGKSSLLSLLSGQRQPSSGSVWINGQDLRHCSASTQALMRAVLPQETTVAFEYAVQDVVELGRFPHRLQPSRDEVGIVQAAMQATGVAALAHRTMPTLSGGERARVQLARVLAQIWEPQANAQARWLLLDEPTAALDLSHQHEVLRLARRWSRDQGVGVVAVLHDLNLALRYADQAIVMAGGVIHSQGRPVDVLNPANVNQVWAVSAQSVLDHDGTPQLLVA